MIKTRKNYVTSMHAEIVDTNVPVLLQYIHGYASLEKDQVIDNSRNGIHHSLAKKC